MRPMLLAGWAALVVAAAVVQPDAAPWLVLLAVATMATGAVVSARSLPAGGMKVSFGPPHGSVHALFLGALSTERREIPRQVLLSKPRR